MELYHQLIDEHDNFVSWVWFGPLDEHLSMAFPKEIALIYPEQSCLFFCQSKQIPSAKIHFKECPNIRVISLSDLFSIFFTVLQDKFQSSSVDMDLLRRIILNLDERGERVSDKDIDQFTFNGDAHKHGVVEISMLRETRSRWCKKRKVIENSGYVVMPNNFQSLLHQLPIFRSIMRIEGANETDTVMCRLIAFQDLLYPYMESNWTKAPNWIKELAVPIILYLFGGYFLDTTLFIYPNGNTRLPKCLKDRLIQSYIIDDYGIKSQDLFFSTPLPDIVKT